MSMKYFCFHEALAPVARDMTQKQAACLALDRFWVCFLETKKNSITKSIINDSKLIYASYSAFIYVTVKINETFPHSANFVSSYS